MNSIRLGIVFLLAVSQAAAQEPADTVAPPAVPPSMDSIVVMLGSPPNPVILADSLYRAGMDSLSTGNFRPAADLFRQLTTDYPMTPRVTEGLYLRAFALYRLGEDSDLKEGLQALGTLHEKFPDDFPTGDAPALEQRILGELARRGDPAAAQQVTDQALQFVAPGDNATSSAECDAGNAASSDDVKIAALNALAQMSAERALPTLQDILNRQDNSSVCLRRTAVLLLGQQRTAGVEMSLLNAARNDSDLEVRKQAVLYLSQFNTDEAISALDSIVRSGTETVLVERAIVALSQSSDPRARIALRAYAERDDGAMKTRRMAITWLLEHNSPEDAAFLRDLYGRLGTEEPEIRRSIMQTVGQIGDSATGRWLIDIARNSADTAVQLRLQALTLATQGATTSDLASLYAPTLEGPIRAQLLEIYSGRARETAALDALGEMAKQDPEAELRKRAVSSISQSQDPYAASVLQAIIKER